MILTVASPFDDGFFEQIQPVTGVCSVYVSIQSTPVMIVFWVITWILCGDAQRSRCGVARHVMCRLKPLCKPMRCL